MSSLAGEQKTYLSRPSKPPLRAVNIILFILVCFLLKYLKNNRVK